MAISVEELERTNIRIKEKQNEQIALRERQTRVEETDKQILDQLAFIRDEIKTLAISVDKQIDRVDTKARWIISTLVASLIAGGILGFNILNYFFK